MYYFMVKKSRTDGAREGASRASFFDGSVGKKKGKLRFAFRGIKKILTFRGLIKEGKLSVGVLTRRSFFPEKKKE